MALKTGSSGLPYDIKATPTPKAAVTPKATLPPLPGPSGLPYDYQPAATVAAAPPQFTATAPAAASSGAIKAGDPGSKEWFDAQIRNSPEYKTALENVDLYNTSGTNQINFQTQQQAAQNALAQQQLGQAEPFYAESDLMKQQQAARDLSTQQQQAALSLGTAQHDLASGQQLRDLGLGTAQHTLDTQNKLDLIDQAVNERTYGQQQKYTKEALTSRGNAGGQLGFELGNLASAWDTAQQKRSLSNEGNQFTFDQYAAENNIRAADANFSFDQFQQAQGIDAGNAQFGYDLLMRDIANSTGLRQLGTTQDQAKLNLSNQQLGETKNFNLEQLSREVAQKRGDTFLNVESQLAKFYFDEATGMYKDPATGQTMSVQQATQTLQQQTPSTNYSAYPVGF